MDQRHMRAAVIRSFGGPEQLEIAEVPVPSPEGDEVLIRVATAGVGIWDAQIRAGEWGDQGSFPLVLGTDGYGIVEAVGPHSPFAVGERVWAYGYGGKKGGFYAEYASVPAACAAHAPPQLPDDVLGGAPTVAVTAWTAIHRVLQIEPEDVVIVHGATGAVGLCAVQFAAWAGARVIAVASHEPELLRQLGATSVLNDRDEAGRTSIRHAASGATKALLLAPWPEDLSGALSGVQVANPNGVDVPKGVDATAFDGVPDRELWDHLNPQIEAHRFALPIAGTFPLERAREAHEALARHGTTGKIVLRVHRA
jgi:NADPH:quinone reductase-like Zn-dependent oxidoreductase